MCRKYREEKSEVNNFKIRYKKEVGAARRKFTAY